MELLSSAVSIKDCSIVDFLFDNNMVSPDDEGIRAILDSVVATANVPLIRTLLNRSSVGFDWACVENACRNGNLDVLKLLYDHRAKLSTGFDGHQILRMAIIHRQEAVVEWLVKYEIVNVIPSMIVLASSVGHLGIVRLLVERSETGVPHDAVRTASLSGHTEIVNYLNSAVQCDDESDLESFVDIVGDEFVLSDLNDVPPIKTVNRNDVVSGYVGQSASRTNELLTESICNVLFIDEAYSSFSDLPELVEVAPIRSADDSTTTSDTSSSTSSSSESDSDSESESEGEEEKVDLFEMGLGERCQEWLKSKSWDDGVVLSELMDLAAADGQIEVIEELSERFGSKQAYCTVNAMTLAAMKGEFETVQYLHANYDRLYRNGGSECTPEVFVYATENGDIDMFRFFWHKPDLIFSDEYSNKLFIRCLVAASRRGYCDLIRFIVLETKCPDCVIRTARDFAYKYDQLEAVNLLIDLLIARMLEEPLHWAIEHSCYSVLNRLSSITEQLNLE